MEKLKVSIPGDNVYLVQEAFKFLRTNIQFCGPDIHVIDLTSCYENEGKTVVSLSIASGFAEIGKKTILVDADMRKSVMSARNLNAGKTRGLSEVLSGLAQPEDVILETQIENLYIMNAGSFPPNPVELLSGQLFTDLIARLRGEYDMIFIDTPPLGAVSDSAVVAPRCDGIILVVGAPKLNRRVALDVVEQLRNSGTPILGAVRNDAVQSSRSGKGKYSYYRYGKKYYRKNYRKNYRTTVGYGSNYSAGKTGTGSDSASVYVPPRDKNASAPANTQDKK